VNIYLIYKRLTVILVISLIIILGLQDRSQAQVITKGPYLADPGKSSITIRWESDKKAHAEVLFGENTVLNRKSTAEILSTKSGLYLYESRLTGLETGTKYFYQVKCGKIKGVVKHFKTAPDKNTPFDFIAMGDSRSHQDIFKIIMDHVGEINPDLIISMGDLVSNSKRFKQWNSQFFTVAKGVIDHIPFISTLGDHEGDSDNGELYRYFFFPHADADNLWFSFDFGDAHFVSLDYRHPYDKNMIEWFKKDMAETKAKWKFVFMHRPCYNMGGHRSTWGRGVWPELFRQYKIDIVFAGHSHVYERFFPVKPLHQADTWPVTYITTGGAGAGLYDVGHSEFLAKVESVHHFIHFSINSDTLTLKTYALNDSLFDSMKIIKHNGKYDKKYLSTVKSQKQLDLTTMFLREISFEIDKIPLKNHAADADIELKSVTGTGDVNFKILLSEKSKDNYKMEPVEGVLHENEKLHLTVKIFSKGDITISKYGDITPALRLVMILKINGKEKIITGGNIEYWPGDM